MFYGSIWKLYYPHQSPRRRQDDHGWMIVKL